MAVWAVLDIAKPRAARLAPAKDARRGSRGYRAKAPAASRASVFVERLLDDAANRIGALATVFSGPGRLPGWTCPDCKSRIGLVEALRLLEFVGVLSQGHNAME
jgi:hypothetical protein